MQQEKTVEGKHLVKWKKNNGEKKKEKRTILYSKIIFGTLFKNLK